MKNSSTLFPRMALGLLILPLTLLARPALSNNLNEVSMPVIELKEITISAERGDGNCFFYPVAEFEGELVAVIQLNEVNIKASGDYIDESQPISKPISGPFYPASKVNGQWTANIQLDEVQIVASKPDSKPQAQAMETQSTPESQVLQFNVRQSFDRLSGFFYNELKDAIRHLIPNFRSE